MTDIICGFPKIRLFWTCFWGAHYLKNMGRYQVYSPEASRSLSFCGGMRKLCRFSCASSARTATARDRLTGPLPQLTISSSNNRTPALIYLFAVKELDLSYSLGETLLVTIYTHYVNLL